MKTEYVDVAIIGAGLSGVGAAVHLGKHCPEKSYALFEGRERMGGTWDLFRYPGIRSDSDMYTLGYKFKPWTNPKAIADGSSILDYIRETAHEYGVEEKVRYQHRVESADWSSVDGLWTLRMKRGDSGEAVRVQSRFIICAAGYYNYEQGHEPHFEGREDFSGEVIHPQHWPEDLDYSGKKVVVIGSGATAVTLVPAMTDKAAHVTMLQRSPSYVASVPEKDVISNRLREFLPDSTVYHMARARNVLLAMGIFNASKRWPGRMRDFLLSGVKKQLGDSVDMKHFSPSYNPWDERLCAVPDGDMFKKLRDGSASVVTDHIERFTGNGIRLKSGQELEADIIITATGLRVQMMGGMDLTLDGESVDFSEKLYYKGAMIEDVPNLSMVFGYTNSSWTLKADLISEYFCRVIRHMDARGYTVATPRNHDHEMEREPFINMNSGYIKRALSSLPQQGSKKPWKLYQNYFKDMAAFKLTPIEDKALVFSNPVSHGYGYGLEEKTPALAAVK